MIYKVFSLMFSKNKLLFIKCLVIMWNMVWIKVCQIEEIIEEGNDKDLKKVRFERCNSVSQKFG